MRLHMAADDLRVLWLFSPLSFTPSNHQGNGTSSLSRMCRENFSFQKGWQWREGLPCLLSVKLAQPCFEGSLVSHKDIYSTVNQQGAPESQSSGCS